jgi:YidC/Oxa1 family membrane protein insertase
MDNQRLILFVVFSFSLLLLWEAWQAKDQPPQQQEASAPARQAATGVPAATQGTQAVQQAGQQAPQSAGMSAGARAISRRSSGA